ncbi:MAG: hypothetical protein HQL61_09965 [Magnetococcales bacterium]|nr:hypothetical protein [Nitrospirota bacterium]
MKYKDKVKDEQLMPQTYDITLKSILKDVPKQFFRMITGFDDARFLDTHFPSVKSRHPDLLMDMPDGSLWHFEIQAQNDVSMDWRMHDYFSMIYQEFQRPPNQVLIYVGDDNLRMGKGLDFKNLKYNYTVWDMREIDCSALSNSEDLSDVILSILCKTDDVIGTLRNILTRALHLEEDALNTYILELFNLSRLRGLSEIVKKEVKSMPVTIDLTKDALYLEGEQKGKYEGLIEGQRKGLLMGIKGMLDIKYDVVGLEIMPSVNKLMSIEKMEMFEELIKRSKTIDELKGFLENNADL